MMADFAPGEAGSLDEAMVDVRTWGRPEAVEALFATLRRDDPVHWTQAKGFRPFWSVTKHADILEIERRSDVFEAAHRNVLMPEEREAQILAMTGGSPNPVKSIVVMDAPEHMQHRVLTQAWFMPANLRKLDEAIAREAKRSVDAMLERGGSCDFAREVAVWYPLRVIMTVLGVPPEDEPLMLKLTQELFGSSDPDTMRERGSAQSTLHKTMADFAAYFGELTASRRREPKDDIATIIATATIDGAPLGPREALGYYIVLATAGHDTTSYTLTGGAHAFACDPAQWALLKAEADTRMDAAVEEMLRWAAPVRHFLRTANADFELRGRTIKAGEAVSMWFNSACRDEEVFERADQFDIGRPPAKHLAFGFGPHLCLGMHLARKEIAAFYRELLGRVSSIEVAGEARWTQSSFIGGIKSLPLRFTPS